MCVVRVGGNVIIHHPVSRTRVPPSLGQSHWTSSSVCEYVPVYLPTAEVF